LADLAQIYENARNYKSAISIYKDLARNSEDKKFAKAVRERAELLQNETQAPAADEQSAPQAKEDSSQEAPAQAAEQEQPKPVKAKSKKKAKIVPQQEDDAETKLIGGLHKWVLKVLYFSFVTALRW